MTETVTAPDAPALNDSVAAELRAVAARQQVSHAVLAARLGVSAMWLSRRMRGITEFSLDDVAAICEALEVDVLDVVAQAVAGTTST